MDSNEDFVERAIKSYSKHEIIDDRGISMKFMNPDSFNMWVKFVDLGNALCVWGDIDTAVFAHAPANYDLRQKIFWMGSRPMLGYASEKWSIGMGMDRREWCEFKAAEDLKYMMKVEVQEHMDDCEMDSDEREAFRKKAKEAKYELQSAIHDNNQNAIYEITTQLFDTDFEQWQHFGMTIRPRIVWAHAACIACARKIKEQYDHGEENND